MDNRYQHVASDLLMVPAALRHEIEKSPKNKITKVKLETEKLTNDKE